MKFPLFFPQTSLPIHIIKYMIGINNMYIKFYRAFCIKKLVISLGVLYYKMCVLLEGKHNLLSLGHF